MTREEAIEILEYSEEERKSTGGEIWSGDEFGQAVDLAIEALKQPEIVRCGECKIKDTEDCPASFTVYEYAPDFVATFRTYDDIAFCSYGERW